MTEQQLFTLLSTDAGINLITTNVFTGDLPEGVGLPAVTMFYVSDEPYNTVEGETGASRKRYTINAWANTYAKAHELIQAVQLAMKAHTRVVTLPLHEEDVGIFRFATDYRIFN